MTQYPISTYTIPMAVLACAASLFLSSFPETPLLRGAFILAGTAGTGAFVAWRYGWRSGFGLLSGLLTVEGTYIAFQLAWVALIVARAGSVPPFLMFYVPFAVMVGVHHGLLTLTGGLVALSGSAAARRLRGPQPT